jgi:hypothetical protein
VLYANATFVCVCLVTVIRSSFPDFKIIPNMFMLLCDLFNTLSPPTRTTGSTVFLTTFPSQWPRGRVLASWIL